MDEHYRKLILISFLLAIPISLFYDQKELKKNQFVTTIPLLPKIYEVSFDVYPTSFTNESSSILLITKGKDNTEYGDNAPAVMLKADKFQISNAVNGIKDYVFNSKAVTVKTWISVKLTQNLERSKYIYRISINNELVLEKENTKPKTWTNMRLYTGSPWTDVQPGFIRNLLIDSK